MTPAVPTPWDVPTPLPQIVTAVGDIANCVFLTDDDVSSIVVSVAPAVHGDDEIQPRAGALQAALRYGVDLAELAQRAKFEAKAGTTYVVELPKVHSGRGAKLPWEGLPAKIVMAGIGDGSAHDLRLAGAAVAKATVGDERVVSIVSADASELGAKAYHEGYLLASYRRPTLKSAAAAKPPADQLVVLTSEQRELMAQRLIDSSSIAAEATWLARDLTSAPAHIATPVWLANRAVAAADAAGLASELWDETRLRKDGFGGILAVGAGSQYEPRLVTVTYDPDAGTSREGTAAHAVVVGKGISYDTGGLAIKPRESMVSMYTDMAGSAVALATVLAAARSELPIRMTAILPLAENAFGAASYRPGDVVTMFDGTTVEMANTDAEGRIVMADAIGYARAHLNPDVLIDVATLTGAATLGLGRTHSAMFSHSDRWAQIFEAAGEATGERTWRMPLVAEYREPTLQSSVAQVRQIADPSVNAGAITAALFLEKFVGQLPWVHLDIAGPGRSTSASGYTPEGPTGYGARLILEALKNWQPSPTA